MRVFVQFVIRVVSRLLGFACTAITLIPFFMGTSTFDAFLKQLRLTEKQFFLAFFVVLTVVSFACLIQYLLNSKKATEAGSEFDDFHEKMLAAVFDMRKKNSGVPEYNTHTAFYGFTKLLCQELCECIAKFLKSKFGKDFSVCIKMIDKKSIEKVKRSANIGDAEVYTFCRGGHSHSTRENNEKERADYDGQEKIHFCVPVKENSDFYSILSNDEVNKTTNVFSCSNLRMHALLSDILKRPEYRNSTPKYWKDYKSTVVVPIRVEKKYINSKEEMLLGSYQTVGFLCIDHKKTISTAMLNELVGYIKGFGESFYPLFHEIAIIDRKIAQLEAKKDYVKGGARH